MSELSDWLEARGLGSLHEVLQAQQIDVDVLPDLTEDDLKDLGIPLGPRRRLLKAIQAEGAVGSAPPPPAVAPIAAPAAEPADTAERRQLSVLFVDLVGSTALSARLDPEEMRQILRRYQNTVAGEIARYGGYVAKFMGDGVLAYFGWPQAHEDEAERAVRAALAAVSAVADLQPGHGLTLAARAAIATGLVVVGDLVGEGAAQEAAVIGDTPNLAARLQELAQPGQVLISESTQRLIGPVFGLRTLGAQQMKGLDRPVAVFAVESERAQPSRFEARAGSRLRPMIGRDHELALLQERWTQAKNGEGQCVLLVGEAGIGKSRITTALLDSVSSRESTILRYQCSPYHLDSAMWPLVQQLTFAARLAPADTPAQRLDRIETLLRLGAEQIDEAVPLVASLLGVPYEERYGALELSPQVQRARTLAVLAAQLQGLARRRPVLVVLEDVHWIDPSTLEFVHLALDQIEASRVLFLLTSRPDGQPVLAGHPHVTRLALNRLSRSAVEAISAGIEGSGALSDTVRQEIIARTDGVPLFVEELTRALIELAEQSKMAAGGARNARDADLNVPATLHDSLMSRLDRLPAVKRVAQIAACIGRNFDYRLLAAVAGLGDAELQSALDGLTSAELVFRRGRPPEATYTFKHALVRDAAANSLLRSEYRRINASIAAAFEAATPQPPPELIAWHAERAGLELKAIGHLRRAGQDATARYANREASNHFDRALRLIGGLPASPERTQLELETLLAVGVARIALHGFASAEVDATYRRALSLSESTGDVVLQFQAARGLWNCVYDRADLENAYLLAQHLCSLAERHPRPEARGLGFRAMGGSLFNQGRFAEALAAFEHGAGVTAEIPRDAGIREHGEAPWIICRSYIAWVSVLMGKIDRGLDALEESVAAARAVDHPMTLAFACHLASNVYKHLDQPYDCLRMSNEAARVSNEHQLVFWQAGTDIVGGWARTRLEADIAQVDRTRRGLHAWQAIGAELHLPTWNYVLARALLTIDAVHDADDIASRGLALAQQHREGFALSPLWCTKGITAERSGKLEEAQECFGKAIAVARAQQALIYELEAAHELASALAHAGKRADAAAALAPVVERFADTKARVNCVDRARNLLRSLQ